MTKYSQLRFSLLIASWLLIIGVAAFDTFLTVKHSAVMHEVELNPIGRFIMDSPDRVSVFVGLKTAGLAIALLFTFALWQMESLRNAVVCSSALVAMGTLGVMGLMFVDYEAIENGRLMEQAQRQVVRRNRSGVLGRGVVPLTSQVQAAESTSGDKSSVADPFDS